MFGGVLRYLVKSIEITDNSLKLLLICNVKFTKFVRHQIFTYMKTQIKLLLLIIVTLLLLPARKIEAQASIQASPTRFIAYSLYNFSKFIDWPAGTTTNTFQIAVVGDKNVYQELLTLSKNKKQGNAIYQVNYFKNSNEVTGTNQIIYLSNFYSGKVRELSSKITTRGVLFVTEREGMTAQGSTISFITDDKGTMGFEIAKDNATKNQLVVQKQLEKLAVKVN
jgi:hypothetical protein